MKVKKIFRKLINIVLLGIVFLLFFVIGCNVWVINSGSGFMVNNIQELPENKVALVLGTARRVKGGFKNIYFYNRINAAADLYFKGKVKHLILSGDNRHSSYNEPHDMRNALLERGVPESAITLDYAGFRTLDSIIRCNKIFKQKKFTIISQQFHNYRAIFIARSHDLEVVAYNADNHPSPKFKVTFREWLARCKAVLDIYMFNMQPKFLGEQIDIQI